MLSVTIINVKARLDRKEHSLRQCKRLGIKDIHWFHPIKHPKGGAYGCYESHITVWKQCFADDPKSKFYFICEDDIQANAANYKSILRNAMKFMNKNYKQIDMIHLHDYCVYQADKLNNGLFSLGQGQCMHAYFISREYIRKNIYKFPSADGTHIDYAMSFLENHGLYTNRQFYMRETFLIQADIESDNVNSMIDNITRPFLDLHNRVVINEQIYRFLQPAIGDEQVCNLHHILYKLLA